MDLSPCSPSLAAAKAPQDGTTPLPRAAKDLLCEAGFCPGAQQPFWWNREKKIQKSPLPHTLMDPTAPQRGRENLRGVTQMTKSIHQAGHALSYGEFCSKQCSTWWALATAPSSGVPGSCGAWGRELREHGGAGTQGCRHTGMQGHRDAGTQGLLRGSGAVPLSNTLPAMICKTIPCNNPSNFLLKNPQVLQDWQNRGRKHSLLSLSPSTHPFQLLPFPFSAQLVLSPPGSKSARAGREYVNMSGLTENSSSADRSSPRDSD